MQMKCLLELYGLKVITRYIAQNIVSSKSFNSQCNQNFEVLQWLGPEMWETLVLC